MSLREKGRDLTQFYDKKPYNHRKKIQTETWQHKTANKSIDYTTTADLLRTVSWVTIVTPIPTYRKNCVIKRTHI